MPRAKPSRNVGGFIVPRLPLRGTAAARKQMLRTLCDEADLSVKSHEGRRLIHETIQALELYPGLSEPRPRPANHRAALHVLLRPVGSLREALIHLDADLRDRLRWAQADLMALQDSLANLERAGTIVDRQLVGDSRGASSQTGREVVVGMIATAFHQYEDGEKDDYLDRLCGFLECACRLGGVPLVRQDRLLRLLPASVKVQR